MNVTVHATSDRGGVDVRVVALRGGVRTGNCLRGNNVTFKTSYSSDGAKLRGRTRTGSQRKERRLVVDYELEVDKSRHEWCVPHPLLGGECGV